MCKNPPLGLTSRLRPAYNIPCCPDKGRLLFDSWIETRDKKCSKIERAFRGTLTPELRSSTRLASVSEGFSNLRNSK